MRNVLSKGESKGVIDLFQGEEGETLVSSRVGWIDQLLCYLRNCAWHTGKTDQMGQWRSSNTRKVRKKWSQIFRTKMDCNLTSWAQGNSRRVYNIITKSLPLISPPSNFLRTHVMPSDWKWQTFSPILPSQWNKRIQTTTRQLAWH